MNRMNMNKSIFSCDPILGCPFDDSEVRMVENWNGFNIGNTVEFQGVNHIGATSEWIKGKIIAIGENAKYLNGGQFVAFAIKVDDVIHLTTHHRVLHVI